MILPFRPGNEIIVSSGGARLMNTRECAKNEEGGRVDSFFFKPASIFGEGDGDR